MSESKIIVPHKVSKNCLAASKPVEIKGTPHIPIEDE